MLILGQMFLLQVRGY